MFNKSGFDSSSLGLSVEKRNMSEDKLFTEKECIYCMPEFVFKAII